MIKRRLAAASVETLMRYLRRIKPGRNFQTASSHKIPPFPEIRKLLGLPARIQLHLQSFDFLVLPFIPASSRNSQNTSVVGTWPRRPLPHLDLVMIRPSLRQTLLLIFRRRLEGSFLVKGDR